MAFTSGLEAHFRHLIFNLIPYKKECVCPAVPNAKCVRKLKGYFLRSKVDEIWHEDRCSGKVNVQFLRILLKIIQQR